MVGGYKPDWEQAAGSSNPNMADLADLPQTRIKRNYHCSRCYFFTQNPRSYLYHLKEEHGERLRIYECQLCIYASRHNQKLQRHLRMVHDLPADGTTVPSNQNTALMAKDTSAKLMVPTSASVRSSRSSSDSNPLFIPSPKSPKRSTRRSHVAPPPSAITSITSSSFTVGPPVKRAKGREEDHAHLLEGEEDMDELLDEDNDSSGTGGAMAEAEMMEEDYLEAEEAAAAAEEEEEELREEEEAERDRAYQASFQSSPGKGEELLRCSVCDFLSKSRVLLQRHERLVHLKKKFFRCVKCNYVTHVKARYTKHVKYHSMPMIKCDMCEFRTPYKWNLDRHLKNHMGGGMYQCSLCNFTAHIKQSLTVHIQNHHLTPERARVTRRRNKVGASDEADASMDAEELDLLRFEREEDLPDMGDDLAEEHEVAALPAKPQAPSASSDMLAKTDPLNFSKQAYESEIQKSATPSYDALGAEMPPTPPVPKPLNKPPPRPIPNLIPIGSMLTHPVASAPDKATPTILRIPQIPKRPEAQVAPPTELSPPILEAVGLLAKADAEKLNVPAVSSYAFPWNTERDSKGVPPAGGAKTSSFFEQLAEKLAPTNINQLICQFCGHEAKCLSEAVRHQKLHSGGPRTRPLPPPNPTSLSSRCQYCRHRCKTRLDLLSHLKTCPEAQLALEEEQTAAQSETITLDNNDTEVRSSSSELTAQGLTPTPPMKTEPHPMENKVFVWNQAPSAPLELTVSEGEADDGISVASDLSETSMVGIETVPGIGTVTEGQGAPQGGAPSSGEGGIYRKVYRCPHCNFWANTASRFHVHIVGHSNSKPFECSQCNYRSNWRWDITKHIKLKGVRDSAHRTASIVILDPAGERHPQQYDQYLTTLRVMENAAHAKANLAAGGLPSASASPAGSPRASPSPGAANLESFAMANVVHMRVPQPPKLTRAQAGPAAAQPAVPSPLRQPPPLTALRSLNDADVHGDENRRTVWKCKRCTFKDGNRDKVVEHIRSVHYGGVHPAPSTFDQDLAMTLVQALGPTTPISVPPFQSSLAQPSPVPAFRCGVCNQVSNWKHVIQRHCRLKHNGNIQVVENRIPEDDGPVLTKESHWTSPSKSPNLTFHGRRGRGSGRISLERKVEIARQSAEEDGLGYILHPDRQQYLCSTCRYACRSLTDMELHRRHHNTNMGLQKCRFCTYNTNQANDLSEHLRLHGVENGEDQRQDLVPDQDDQSLAESAGKRHKCPQCPYVSDSKSQFLYHKQFHRPRGAPFKCSQCSYNVSRRHLLNQHLRVHGLPPLKGGDGLETPLTDTPPGHASNASYASESEAGYDSDNCLEIDEDGEDHRPLSAASTPLKAEPNLTPSSIGASSENFAHLNLNPQRLPRLADADTRSLPDIPLTWVSRPDGKFCKMFKCRYCPHVNFRKVNIQEHEKRHQSSPNGNNNNNADLQRCHMCNYRCNNAGVLSAHVKVHQYILGVIHGLVDPTVTDEDQLQTLAALGDAQYEAETHLPSEENTPRLDLLLPSSHADKNLKAENDLENNTEKVLHFCQNCPARFLNENELVIHEKFHLARFTHRCDMCSYTARQKHHLLAHLRVHSREYQDRTQYLLQQYPVSEQNPQPQILAVQSPDTANAANQQPIDLSAHAPTPSSSLSPARGSPSKNGVQVFRCAICPATFSKIFALEYHSTLHGGDGAFKCKYCDYAVKTAGNLAKHESLHKKEESVPLSGVELARHIQDLDVEDFEDEDCAELNNKSKNEDEEESRYAKHVRLRAKSFKCPKCPSAFEKREQYELHVSFHGSQHHYRCDKCDYAVKNYASYLQHTRKHDIHEALTNQRDSELEDEINYEEEEMGRENEAEIGHNDELRESTKVILSLAEQQQLMLQKRRLGSFPKKESESLSFSKKWFACHLCPYSASRKEFVDSHCQRHECNGGAGAYKCDFCDYRAAQKHLLKEHAKWHFKSRKQWAKLDGYMQFSSLSVTSRPRKPSSGGAQPDAAEEQVFSTEDAENAWNEDDEEDDDGNSLVIDLSTGETILNYPADEVEGGAKEGEEMEEEREEYNEEEIAS